MQDSLNCVLSSDWRNTPRNNRLAAVLETAELIEHFPWKWWKNGGVANVDQAKMELVDVWHFILSEILILLSYQDFGHLASETIHADIQEDEKYNDVTASGLALIRALTGGNMDAVCSHFHWVRSDLNMSWEELYKWYMGKNLLNKLRWETGYGTAYIKEWFGQEDNEYLASVLHQTDANDPDFSRKVATALAVQYGKVVQASLTGTTS